MKNRGFILILMLFFVFKGVSQNNTKAEIDSLLKTALSFYKTNQDTALYYSEIAYNKALVLNDTNLIARSIIYKNTFLIAQKRYDEAEALFAYNFKNLEFLDEIYKADTYYNFGSIKYLKENYDLALENYFLSVDHYQKANVVKGLQKAYLQIGVIYSKYDRRDLSDYFYSKSMSYGGGNHSEENNLEASQLDSESGKLNVSKKMLEGIDDINNSRLAAFVYYNMGQSYFYLKDYKNVISTNLKSIEIKKNINFTSDIDKSYAFIGESYLNLNNYERAIIYLNKANDNSTKRKFKLKINELLSQAYENAGDYKNALKASNAYNKLKDSLNLIEENEHIAKITAKFETEKQAQEIEILETDNQLKASQLSNQKNILIASGIGVLLLMFSLFFAYKNHKTKQNLQFSELTQKLLQMQLNPHFLFNALNGIQYFIKKNDVKKSTRYISNFSGLMRHILENSVEKFISVKEDYETIKDFLELQQLVNNNAFNYEISVDEQLDVTHMCIPPMFTQPFVENAIIHGVNGLEHGKIKVNYKLLNNHIIVEIIDNGKGINHQKNNANSLHKSMGTSITRQRMENLLKTEKYPVELEIESKNATDGEQGTKIVLTFPLKYL